ncbi:MAG: NAD(P)H-dependent oxidoreductase subunit E, partial [Spirochaetes bacterium]|nr:NAD(P)H-dependent oxidoreductase subunit E [Spirochaetota bacterium]
MATTAQAGSVDEVIREHPPSREHLISILQDVQGAEGYLSRENINRIAEYLHLPPSKIYGVA